MKLSFLYKSIFFFCFFLLSFSVSAQFEKGMKEYKGMRYKIHQKGKGKALTDSSIFQIHMSIFNSADSILRETYTEEFPTIINLREDFMREMPLVELLMKGKMGDSLTIFTHVDSIFQGSAAASRPDFIPEGSWIRQELQLVKSYTLQEYKDIKKEIEKSMQQEQEEDTEEVVMEEQNQKEDEIETNEENEQETTTQKDPNTYYIDDNQEDYIENVYMKLNDITDYKKTESGLFYRIEKQGTLVKKGDKLRVHYEGTFLMSGEKFDSSFDRGEPFEVTVEMGNLIQGWEEGIPLIGKGGKGTLYIPAKLAYGKEKTANIPPNSILIYRIEILEK